MKSVNQVAAVGGWNIWTCRGCVRGYVGGGTSGDSKLRGDQ